MTRINGMRLNALMVEHGMEVRARRLVESKRLNGGGLSQEDGLACGRTGVFALGVRISGKWGSNHGKRRPR